MSESNEELTPEQEELAQQFAAELEGVSGGQIGEDEDGKWWLTFGDFSVPVSIEQQQEFSDALYYAALHKIHALQRAQEPATPYAQVHVFSWALAIGFAGTVAWGLAKLFGLL